MDIEREENSCTISFRQALSSVNQSSQIFRTNRGAEKLEEKRCWELERTIVIIRDHPLLQDEPGREVYPNPETSSQKVSTGTTRPPPYPISSLVPIHESAGWPLVTKSSKLGKDWSNACHFDAVPFCTSFARKTAKTFSSPYSDFRPR